MNEEPNYLAHAFKSQYNFIGLGTAIGFAILSGSFLPLIVAAGVELALLPLVSGSDRFQRLVRARLFEEKQEEKEVQKQVEASEMLRSLPDAERHRYRALQTLADEIRQNYKGLDSSSRMLLDELVQKLEFLLAFYLRMRYSLVRYDSYFATTDGERIQERIVMLDHEIARGPEKIKAIKSKTRAVLVKRIERYNKALENRHMIEAQTEAVQEVLQLLRDQSYSMQDPRTITEQLDGLVHSAEETERGVRDMEDLLQIEDDLLATGALSADLDADLELEEEERPAAPVTPVSKIRSMPSTPPSPPPPPRKKLTH